MKQGAMMLLVLLVGQLVGAAVMYFLADMANRHAAWAREEVWPWAVIAIVGIACALCFLQGAVTMLGGNRRFKREKP